MKTSWIVFTVMMWITITYFASVVEQVNLLSVSALGNAQTLIQPTGTDFGLGLTSLITNVWTYMKVFISFIFLWYPSIWTGNWVWVYYFVFLDIAVAIVFSLVTILRGVHSG
jgi:hypothetical protein